MQANRLWYNPRAALLSAGIVAALVAVMATAPFSGLYLFGATALLLPFVLQIVLTTSGPLVAATCAGMVGYGLYLVFGPAGALFGLYFLLGLVLLQAICLWVRLPYPRVMIVMTLGYAVLVTLLYLLARRQLGDDPFVALTQQAMAALDTMPGRDIFLNTFYRYDLLSVPAELADNLLVEGVQGWTFSPLVLSEFYKQAGARVELWLRALLPTLLSTQSVQWGVAGLFVSMHFGAKQAQRVAYLAVDDAKAQEILPSLGLPVFSNWFIPGELGYILYGFVGVWLLIRVSGNPAMLLAGQMLYNVAAALFTIQGLSFMNFAQKKRDTNPKVRGLTLILMITVLPLAALMMGVWEQISNARKLRPGSGKSHDMNRRNDI